MSVGEERVFHPADEEAVEESAPEFDYQNL